MRETGLTLLLLLCSACDGAQTPTKNSASSPATSSLVTASGHSASTTTAPREVARDVRSLDRVRSIVSTTHRLYALHHDASVSSWGVLGSRGPRTEPIEQVRAVFAAADTVCALAVAGNVYCKLEQYPNEHHSSDAAQPWRNIGLSSVVALDGHELHWVKADGESRGGPLWLAVLGDGTVKAFELGRDPSTLSIRDINGVSRAKLVAAGDDHACVVLDDGRVECWHQLLAVQGSDDPGPRPSGVEKLQAFTDAIATDGPCMRRRHGPLTCLVRDTSWPVASARSRRARFEERPGVARHRETSFKSCLVYEDARVECRQPWSLATSGVVDIALGASFSCVLTKHDTVHCAPD